MTVSINKGREDGEEVILTSSHQGENLHCNTDVENNRMDDYQGKHLAYVFFAKSRKNWYIYHPNNVRCSCDLRSQRRICNKKVVGYLSIWLC